MPDIKVISLGGSIIAPDGVDVPFLRELRDALLGYLEEDPGRRLIVICGGGKICRDYQRAYRQLASSPSQEAEDWVGVMATRLNAELVRQLLAPHAPDPVVTDPTSVSLFAGRVLVGAGWKPGFSTDYDAVLLAQRFSAPLLINLSNVSRVYSADPGADSSARPLERLSWEELLRLTGTTWKPGLNAPFDPVAARRAREIGLRCIVADGRDLANTLSILRGEAYAGTTIGPD